MFLVIIFFAGLSFSSYVTFKNCTTYIANEIGINQRFYPKHYVTLNKKMYKILKTNKRKIPKFLYIELFIIFMFTALFPINTIIYLFSGYNGDITWSLIVIESIAGIINILYLLIFYLIYKYIR